MELQSTPARGALDQIEAILDGFDPAHAERGDLLAGAQQARGLASRLTAVAGVLLARADAIQESMRDKGTPTTSWLAIMDTDQLTKAAPEVLAQVAAERADETLERRLQRQTEAAQRNRSLVFGRDNNGSVTFNGSLPLTDGETWIAMLDAYTESKRRNLVEERDPLTSTLTPQKRRADALLAMIGAQGDDRRAPRVGGDRPRVVVTLDYETLRRDAAGAGLIGDTEPISAGDLRRLCCEADLVPAVLGGPSVVLDVGRQARLVTPEIRAALVLRDCGCAFPGCHARPAECEAHHIIPWWKGGLTAPDNLCLLCHLHHGLIESAKYGTRDQWEVRIAQDCTPEVIPPRRYDPQRRPLRHARFHTRALARSA